MKTEERAGHLFTTITALMRDYVQAVNEGRLADWSAAMHAVVDLFAAPCNLPFERVPQHEADPGFGPVPPAPDPSVIPIDRDTPD